MAWVDQGQQYWLASVVICAGVGDPISSNSRVRCKADHSAVVAQALTNILLLERQSGHLKLDGAEMYWISTQPEKWRVSPGVWWPAEATRTVLPTGEPRRASRR